MEWSVQWLLLPRTLTLAMMVVLNASIAVGFCASEGEDWLIHLMSVKRGVELWCFVLVIEHLEAQI